MKPRSLLRGFLLSPVCKLSRAALTETQVKQNEINAYITTAEELPIVIEQLADAYGELPINQQFAAEVANPPPSSPFTSTHRCGKPSSTSHAGPLSSLSIAIVAALPATTQKSPTTLTDAIR